MSERPQLLLVDDDVSFCDAMARALERRGLVVHRANDTASALREQQRAACDYAVVDLRIGDESGLSLVQALLQRDPALRIVVLTAFASIATAVEAIKLGAVHYLTKPAQANEIVDALRREQSNPDLPLPDTPLSVKRLEWEHIQKVLHEHDNNVSAAARALGMHRRTIQRKLQKRPVKR